MLSTFFTKNGKYLDYIPAEVFLRDKENLFLEENEISYCCNFDGYEFEVVLGKPQIIFEWVYEGPLGFLFKT